MKRNFIVAGVMLLALMVIGTTVVAYQEDGETKYNFKLIHEDRYIMDEMLNEDYRVIVEYQDEDLHDFYITKNETITLDTLDVPDDKVIKKWDIVENEKQYIISPVLISENEVNISFSVMNGGKLLDDRPLPYLTESVEKGTKLNSVIPEIENEDDFYFAGWYTLEDIENEIEIKEEDREDLKELNSELKKKEKSLSKQKDKDKEKKIKKEIKKIKEKIEEKKEEKQFDIEIVIEYQFVENIDKIELDEDKEYIAVLYPDINENNKDDRKEKINLSIDFGLDNEVIEEEIHVGQPIKLSEPYHEDYIFIDWYTDNKYEEKYTPELSLEKDTEIFAQWKTAQEIIVESSENLIYDKGISDDIESYLSDINEKKYEQSKKESKEKQEKLKEKYEQEFVQHTQKRYALKNFNTNQYNLLKFYDDETFLFSLALPYGRTLELLNSQNNKLKEYGVRQESSIDLNGLINNSDSLDFEVKTIKRNNAVITQIYPKTNNKEME